MTKDQIAKSEICPMAWSQFNDWLHKSDNLPIKDLILSTNHWILTCSTYISFFMSFVHEDEKIRRMVIEFSLCDPKSSQEDQINMMFVRLENFMKVEA